MIFGLLYFCVTVVIVCVNRSRSSFILCKIVKRHSRQSNVRRIWTCADNAYFLRLLFHSCCIFFTSFAMFRSARLRPSSIGYPGDNRSGRKFVVSGHSRRRTCDYSVSSAFEHSFILLRSALLSSYSAATSSEYA